MPNLKSLKTRIRSVKSTRKITQAMKLVSAAKLRRARERAEAATPFAVRMERLLATIAASAEPQTAPPLLIGRGTDTNHLVVVVSSDRGLCGALNSAVVRAVKGHIMMLLKSGKKVKLLCVGKKGREQLEREYGALMIEAVEGLTRKKRIDYQDAEGIAKTIQGLFEQGICDVCTLFYNEFKSVLVQKVSRQQVIPLMLPKGTEVGEQGTGNVYEFEPAEEKILEDLLTRNLAVQIYRALLENQASEQGARMTAMDNATRNAGDMMKKLTLVYNRTRQAVITKELIEIISGAEAL